MTVDQGDDARFRVVADRAPVMVWETDASGSCVYLSHSWYAYTGQTPEEALGFGWLEATHPEDKTRTAEVFESANAERVPFRLEYRLRRSDGEYRWAMDAALPQHDEHGTFRGYVGSVVDIGDRKAVEDARIADFREPALHRPLAVGDLTRDEEHRVARALPPPKSQPVAQRRHQGCSIASASDKASRVRFPPETTMPTFWPASSSRMA